MELGQANLRNKNAHTNLSLDKRQDKAIVARGAEYDASAVAKGTGDAAYYGAGEQVARLGAKWELGKQMGLASDHPYMARVRECADQAGADLRQFKSYGSPAKKSSGSSSSSPSKSAALVAATTPTTATKRSTTTTPSTRTTVPLSGCRRRSASLSWPSCHRTGPSTVRGG